MTHVTHIHAHRILPELSVFVLAVARAITRSVAFDNEQIRALLSGWSLTDVTPRDIEASLTSMVAKGLVDRPAQEFRGQALTETGIGAVTTPYGGRIRMIDRAPTVFSILNSSREPGHA